jgi:hypothetical protein
MKTLITGDGQKSSSSTSSKKPESVRRNKQNTDGSSYDESAIRIL